MGKVRKKISKLIPKEAKPFLPYAALMIPGLQGAGGFLANQGIKNTILQQALIAGATKGITDDKASLKDVARTSVMAAAPQAISEGIGSLGQGSGKFADFLNKTKTLKDGTETISIVDKVSSMANPETPFGAIKLAGAQGTVDYGIKAAELNKDALERYNADLLAQGIGDKVARRTAIFDIFKNAGYDDNDVNKLLDKYSYAKGGKVDKPAIPADELARILEEFIKQQDKQEEIRRQNKADGGEISGIGEEVRPKMTEASMEGFAKSYENFLKRKKEKEKENKAMGGRVGFEGGGSTKRDPRTAVLVSTLMEKGMSMEEALDIADKEFPRDNTEDIESGLGSALKGFESAFGEPLTGKVAEPMRIIPGFARGGITDIDIRETMTEEPDNTMMASRIDYDDVAQSLFQEYLDMGMTPDQAAAAVRDYLDSSKMGLKDGGNVSSGGAAKGGSIAKLIDRGVTRSDALNLWDAWSGGGKKGSFHDFAMGYFFDDYADGGKVIPIMPKGVFYKGKAKDYPGVSKAMKDALKKRREKKAEGGLLGLKMGGVPAELDYRGGGMIQVGSKEKADDVPARLSKNEFVMTADAVKGAGGGDPRRGAERMYQMMDQFEAKV